MPLYGHEMDETVTPLEAGLDFFVKLDKDDFAGKAALISAGKPKQIRVGLAVTGRGIVREHCDIYLNDVIVGHTTSGTFCPFVNKPIAMASLKTEFTKIGTKFEADVRRTQDRGRSYSSSILQKAKEGNTDLNNMGVSISDRVKAQKRQNL